MAMAARTPRITTTTVEPNNDNFLQIAEIPNREQIDSGFVVSPSRAQQHRIEKEELSCLGKTTIVWIFGESDHLSLPYRLMDQPCSIRELHRSSVADYSADEQSLTLRIDPDIAPLVELDRSEYTIALNHDLDLGIGSR